MSGRQSVVGRGRYVARVAWWGTEAEGPGRVGRTSNRRVREVGGRIINSPSWNLTRDPDRWKGSPRVFERSRAAMGGSERTGRDVCVEGSLADGPSWSTGAGRARVLARDNEEGRSQQNFCQKPHPKAISRLCSRDLTASPCQLGRDPWDWRSRSSGPATSLSLGACDGAHLHTLQRERRGLGESGSRVNSKV